VPKDILASFDLPDRFLFLILIGILVILDS